MLCKRTYYRGGLLAAGLVWIGCGPLQIVVPEELAQQAIQLPVHVEQRAVSGSADKAPGVSVSFESVSTTATSAETAIRKTPIEERGFSNTWSDQIENDLRYEFSVVTQPEQMQQAVACLFERRYVEESTELDSTTITSYENESYKLSCEMMRSGDRIGAFSLTQAEGEREVRGTLEYESKRYDIASVHHVTNWSFPRGAPYGFDVRRDGALLSTIQTDAPRQIYATPDIDASDRQAVFVFTALWVYKNQLAGGLGSSL